MKFRRLAISVLASALLLASGAILAADKDQVKEKTQDKIQDQTQDKTQLRDQDRIYGSQLMTQEERLEYRNKMRNLKTQQEREAFQLEHHKQLQERAKEKGITLPEQPMRPGAARPGSMGGRMGPGQ
jgi:uncharacterized membrane protein YhiD involved in acid resistance